MDEIGRPRRIPTLIARFIEARRQHEMLVCDLIEGLVADDLDPDDFDLDGIALDLKPQLIEHQKVLKRDRIGPHDHIKRARADAAMASYVVAHAPRRAA